MRITHAIGHEVVVPARPGLVNSDPYGPAVFDRTPKIILEVHTDEGLVGLGETLRGTPESAVRACLGALTGVALETLRLQEPPLHDFAADDMFAHEHAERPHRLLERSFNSGNHIAIHAALFDLLGKRCGVPAHALLGGSYRQRVRVDYWMGRMTPADSARVCAAGRDAGYLGVKCKCALEDDNVERAEAVRDACGPAFQITFDPNERFYRPPDALAQLKRLAAVGNVGCVEDPFPKTQLASYRWLRDQALFPVAIHIIYGPDLIEAIRARACDYVNFSGLPWDIRKGGDVCWAAGVPAWHGSGMDLGVLEAVYLHTIAATKSMSRPSDLLGRTIRAHNLITDPMPVVDGHVAVPSGAGLGVELDRDALERYETRGFRVDVG